MKQFFQNLFSKIAGFGKNLVAFLAPIVMAHGVKLLEEGLPIALEIVTTLQRSGHDNELKREIAVKNLKETLVQRGIAASSDLATSTLNWLVETAVLKLKAGN